MSITRTCRDVNGGQICWADTSEFINTVPPRVMTHDEQPGKIYRYDHMEGHVYVYLESIVG